MISGQNLYGQSTQSSQMPSNLQQSGTSWQARQASKVPGGNHSPSHSNRNRVAAYLQPNPTVDWHTDRRGPERDGPKQPCSMDTLGRTAKLDANRNRWLLRWRVRRFRNRNITKPKCKRMAVTALPSRNRMAAYLQPDLTVDWHADRRGQTEWAQESRQIISSMSDETATTGGRSTVISGQNLYGQSTQSSQMPSNLQQSGTSWQAQAGQQGAGWQSQPQSFQTGTGWQPTYSQTPQWTGTQTGEGQSGMGPSSLANWTRWGGQPSWMQGQAGNVQPTQWG